MRKLIAATELQYGRGNNAYYKIYVQGQDGRMLPGTRTLRAFQAGRTLNRKIKEMQANIDAGAYDRLADRHRS